MFCPECRKYCEAPVEEDLPAAKKRSTRDMRCADCGSLLARDRLMAEFPAAEQLQQAGCEMTPQHITIDDVLRETAAPNAIDSFRSFQNDNSASAASSHKRPGRFPWRSNDSGWMRTDSPQIPRNFGRPGGRWRGAEMVLAIAALSGVFAVMLSLSLHDVAVVPNHTATAPPAASVVSLGSDSPVSAALLHKSAADRLAGQIGRWSRSGPSFVDARSAQPSLIAASYTDGVAKVEVLAQTQPTVRVAEATFHDLVAHLHGPASTAPASTAPAKPAATPALAPFHGKPSAVVDGMVDAAAQPDGAVTIYGSPAQPALPHRLIWLDGRTIYTVASDTAASRDDFANQFWLQ